MPIWSCVRCTFDNPESSLACEMCENEKPPTVHEDLETVTTTTTTTTTTTKISDEQKKTSSTLVSIKDIRKQRNAVCKIGESPDTPAGIGFYAIFDGQPGIITTHDILKNSQTCQKSHAWFEDQQEFCIKFDAQNFFFTDEKHITFVSCEQKALEEKKIEPWSLEKINTVTERDLIHIYTWKMKSQHNVNETKAETFGYYADIDKCSRGAPVFLGPNLVGIHQESIDSNEQIGKYNQTICIHEIVNWLKIKQNPKIKENEIKSVPSTIKTKQDNDLINLIIPEFDTWLFDMGLEKYAGHFKDTKYADLDMIKELDTEGINDMIRVVGLKPGAKKKMERGIKVLKGQIQPLTPVSKKLNVSDRVSDMPEKKSLHNTTPIFGLENIPVVGLKEAMARTNLKDGWVNGAVRASLWNAKNKIPKIKDCPLNEDEFAAIYMYTMECDFYRKLNAALRSEDRSLIKPYFHIIKLLLFAMHKLPQITKHLWRGVKKDLSSLYDVGESYHWWSFTSCTSNITVLGKEMYCGKTGERTMFKVLTTGVNINKYSAYGNEDEILIWPGILFKVKANAKFPNGFNLIEMEENDEFPKITDGWEWKIKK